MAGGMGAAAGSPTGGRRGSGGQGGSAAQPAPDAAAPDLATATPDTGGTATDTAGPSDTGAAPDARADGRVDGAATPSPDGPTTPPASGGKRVVVTVGYGGVRARSLDSGATWEVTGQVAANGGDDGNLLRSVAYGNGLWVAGGWDKNWTSPDGKEWTLRPHKFGIIQGMAFGNGVFVATSISGDVLRSDDGLTWTRVKRIETGSHTRVIFALGKFAAWGDPGLVMTSADGITWERAGTTGSAAYCGGTALSTQKACFGDSGAWGDGVYLRPVWKGKIARSTDGKTWTTVFTYPANAFDVIAFGPAAPSP